MIESTSSLTSAPVKPWWCKARTFYVTNDFADWLARCGLPEHMREFCAFVQNKVISQTDRDKLRFFTNVHSDVWRKKMGTRNPTKVIGLMVANGFLEVNRAYRTGTGTEQGFTMSYRLPPKCWASGVRSLSFKVRNPVPPKDESEITSPVLSYFLDSLNQLTLRDAPLPATGEPKRDACIAEYAEKIQQGIWNVHFSPQGRRCYHSVICAPAELRPLLMFKAKPDQPIFESDVKTCHPVLLLTLATDEAEREAYRRLLSGDIYQEIAAFSAVAYSRGDIKELIWVFVNGRRTDNCAAEFFQARLPILAAAILAHPNPAVYLQEQESNIICRTVGVVAMQRGIWFVPQHDGFLTKSPEDTAMISNLVQDEFKRVCGYRPAVKTECLNGPSPMACHCA